MAQMRAEIRSYFATPLVIATLPDAAELNAELTRMILERERQVIGAAHDDDDFIREMTGAGKAPKSGYGFDAKAAERIYSDYRAHKHHKKRKKSFLDELFD